MQVAPPVGQIWNQFWWHHLVVKFWTNTSGTTYNWPNLEPMQVAFYLAGEITQVKESIPWVRCASGNVLFILVSCSTCRFPPRSSWKNSQLSLNWTISAAVDEYRSVKVSNLRRKIEFMECKCPILRGKLTRWLLAPSWFKRTFLNKSRLIFHDNRSMVCWNLFSENHKFREISFAERFEPSHLSQPQFLWLWKSEK